MKTPATPETVRLDADEAEMAALLLAFPLAHPDPQLTNLLGASRAAVAQRLWNKLAPFFPHDARPAPAPFYDPHAFGHAQASDTRPPA